MFIHGLYFFTCNYFEAAFCPLFFPLKSLFDFSKFGKSNLLKIFLIFAAAALFGVPGYDFKAK